MGASQALIGARFLPAARRAGAKESARPTLSMVRDHPALRRILIAGDAIEAGLELCASYMPIYGRSVGLSASGIGLVMSAYAAALMAIRFVMPALVRGVGEERVLRAVIGGG